MSADLDLLRETALEAGQLALAMLANDLTVTHKPGGSPVTDADLAVDALVRRRLQGARPDYGWLSEETADDHSRLSSRRLFMVDPIDGTAAYLRGRPYWSVSLAVVENGVALCGVIHAPALDELYEAERGGGARLNGRPIHAAATDTLDGCAMLGVKDQMADWPAMRIEGRNSVALRMALVAAGTFDAAVALSSKHDWDIAAGLVIAAEAGATVTDHTGAALALNGPSVLHQSLVTAAPALHPLILSRTATIQL